ncbi:hypothetical protein MHBO_005069 [Bonamia ostreae]|uniref:Uncharacterized protein n=1 Tax=Bonamia ostreae TaxID=126728 RepID=A0ABV2AV02_9EUKA
MKSGKVIRVGDILSDTEEEEETGNLSNSPDIFDSRTSTAICSVVSITEKEFDKRTQFTQTEAMEEGWDQTCGCHSHHADGNC